MFAETDDKIAALEGERARSDHRKQAGLADLIAGVSHGHAASALSGQVEWRLVIRDSRAAEEIGTELGDRRVSAAQVCQQAAVFLDRQASFFVPPATDGRINNITVRGTMEREPGAAASRENPASGFYNIPGRAGRWVGDFRSPKRTKAVTE